MDCNDETRIFVQARATRTLDESSWSGYFSSPGDSRMKNRVHPSDLHGRAPQVADK